MKRTVCYLALCAAGMIPVWAYGQSADWMGIASQQAGLGDRYGFNVFVADINNDQYPDFLALKGDWSIGSEDALRVFLNVADTSGAGKSGRVFLDITASSGVNAMPDGSAVSRGVIVAALADVNNDGYIDLVRGNYYHANPAAAPDDRCEVLLGDGQGHFTWVPGNGLHELGVINATGMSFLDYDRDGNIDLFISRWFDNYGQNQSLWSPGILMRGHGDGTFTDVSAQAGITQGEPMYGCSVVDWNNDGWPDIATAPYCRTGGQLWRNNANGTFTNVAAAANYNARYMGGDGGQNLCMWSAAPEDYDNDGDMDFFFSLVHGGTGQTEGRSAIVINGGPGQDYKLTVDRSLTSRKAPAAEHLGDYDASWFDLDNDGLMDMAMAQGHYDQPLPRLYLFRQGQDHKLTDVTGDLGMVRTETNNLHLLEVLDYDLDGDDDVLICRDALPRAMHLLENRIGQDNHWCGVTLRAPAGVNRSCIGARIYLWSGGVQRMREVYAGRGNNGGQQPFSMLFGLGSQGTIDSILVRWPDAAGTTTTVRRPPRNRYLEIGAEGLSVPAQEDLPGLRLRVYPNPATDFLLVQLDGNTPVSVVSVYDISGRCLRTQAFGKDRAPVRYVSVSSLPPGMYLVHAVTEQGQQATATWIRSGDSR